MIVRARAPLRLGLAGGGTDVSPYSDIYGGAVLNATISMYAYATIEPLEQKKIIFHAVDKGLYYEFDLLPELELDGNLDLLKGVYNRVVREFNRGIPLSFKLTTYVDAPPGSGLGSSSALVVAVLSSFSEWLKLPLGEYDIAHLAYEIERLDLKMSGGKQDQYAASFGGFNFIEFYKNDKVIVNPLRIRYDIVNELQFNILLYFTGISRVSSEIIEEQIKSVKKGENEPLEAMHKTKEQAFIMKEAILKGRLELIGEILDHSWQYKRKMAKKIANELIDEIYTTAKMAGASGGKVSGAGGGGFMMLYCPRNSRYEVIQALKKFGGEFRRYSFTDKGVETWVVQ